ncbi:unnamed protein product [Peniophora sp. CBMAI 1063]|nr:unnamed protein product [Peniophora sp. CBMAI 1063]
MALLMPIFVEVCAQNFSLDANWLNPAANDSRGDREYLANAAAQFLVGRIISNGSLEDNTDSQALASMYSTLSLQGTLSGNQMWKSVVTSNLLTWENRNDVFANGTSGSTRTVSNAAQWGLAFIYAYEAYGDESFLTLAQGVFEQIYPLYISAEDANTYQAPGNRTFQYNATNGSCFSDVAGGVWWLPDEQTIDLIYTDAVGPFAVLSGHLYEATSDDKYMTVGMQSTNFLGVEPWMWEDAPNYLVHSKLAVYACGWVESASAGPQGWYMQALATWGNITGNPQIITRLRQLVWASTRNEKWAQLDGILIDPPPDPNEKLDSDNLWDDKAILIRGLSETLRRFPTATDMVPFIEGFLNVQYNDFISHAREPGANTYSTALSGPPPPSVDSSGNIFAMDVLNAAFDILPRLNGTSSNTTSPATQSTSASPTHFPVGAIAGGVGGGMGGVAVLLGALFWYRRRRRLSERSRSLGQNEIDARPTHMQAVPEIVSIEPYTLMDSRPSRRSKGAPPVSTDYLEMPSSYVRAESSSSSAVDSPGVGTQDDEYLTVSAFRRMMGNMMQERVQESTPPEYSSRAA